jgi:hypothetical protein
MSKKPRPPLLDLVDRIEQCEGMRRYGRGTMWAHIFYTFSKNGIELRDLLKRYEDPNQAMLRALQTRSPDDNQFRADTIRALHNFLAAAGSLVEHTRNFMREVYAGQPFLREYEKRIESEIRSSGLVRFVHDLRNYMLHKGIPLVRSSLEVRSGEQPKFSVALDLARMRTWDRWTPEARAYMDSQPDHVRISMIVEPYLEKIVYFHQWVTNRRQDVDRQVMEELHKLQEQLRELLKEGNQTE